MMKDREKEGTNKLAILGWHGLVISVPSISSFDIFLQQYKMTLPKFEMHPGQKSV